MLLILLLPILHPSSAGMTVDTIYLASPSPGGIFKLVQTLVVTMITKCVTKIIIIMTMMESESKRYEHNYIPTRPNSRQVSARITVALSLSVSIYQHHHHHDQHHRVCDGVFVTITITILFVIRSNTSGAVAWHGGQLLQSTEHGLGRILILSLISWFICCRYHNGFHIYYLLSMQDLEVHEFFWFLFVWLLVGLFVSDIIMTSWCKISKSMAKKVPGLHVHSLMIGDNVIQVITIILIFIN